MLRHLALVAFCCLPATAGFAQETCDPATTPATCTEAVLNFCGTDNQTGTVDCGAAGFACGQADCVGACTDFDGTNCIGAAVGDACLGISPLANADPADDDAAGAVQCSGDLSCSLVAPTDPNGDPTDACVAHVGPACTAGGETNSCTGDTWTICLADTAGTFALASNIAVDCTLFGVTCGQTACDCDAQCGTGGACTGGFCDFGNGCAFEVDPADCTGTGEGEGEGDGGEGEGEGESGREGEGEGEGDSGSVCGAYTHGGTPVAGLAVFGAVLALRRRRR